MNPDQQTMGDEQETAGGELDVRHSDARYLPKTLDPVITMAAVQRYVESERYRSRRVLLWTTGVFAVVLLAVVALFVVVGSVVLRSNRETNEIVGDVSRRAAAYAVEMAEVSAKVGQVQDLHRRTQVALEEGESERHTESRVLKHDLERFSRWIAESQQQDSGQLQQLQDQLRKLDKASAEREAELLALRKQYADLQETFRLAGPGAAAATPGQRPEPSAGLQTVPAVSNAAVPAVPASVVATPAPPAGQREIRVMDLPNGDRYEGEFRNGLFNGWGVYTYRSGDRYEGEFAEDLKHGKGTYTSSDGEKYVGEFVKDRRQGQGTLFLKNGDRYVGSFENGLPHGQGTMTYQNGGRFSGDFNHGQKHGAGTFAYANGDKYEGGFLNDERNGQGTYSFRDGAVFVGTFKNGRRHGNGRYRYATGEEYIGEFRDGKKEGLGECIYPGGVKVKGRWKDDSFAGAVNE
jgi:hypothetical protein